VDFETAWETTIEVLEHIEGHLTASAPSAT
jgi:hypothetical protein